MEKKVETEQTLAQFLQAAFPDTSKSALRSWVKVGRVFVDNKKAQRFDMVLTPGQIVELERKVEKVGGRVKQLYKDSHLVVLDKPSGLLSVATESGGDDTLHNILKDEYKNVYVVHRLDQETSGVILFALTEKCFEGLKELFKEHTITRQYEAIVEGRVRDDKGTWENYLYEDKHYKMHVTEDPKKGEKAITHFVVLERGVHYTRLLLTLETGKKNQIRVQAEYAGHSVAGDKKYGALLTHFKRLALHAVHLSFVHPITEKLMKFDSKAPRWFHV